MRNWPLSRFGRIRKNRSDITFSCRRSFGKTDLASPILFVDDILCRNKENSMTTQVGKWGNSLAVRIPGTYAKELDLQEGAEMEVTRVKDGLLLKRRTREYTLNELLKQITPENLHGETDWGAPVGNEAW